MLRCPKRRKGKLVSLCLRRFWRSLSALPASPRVVILSLRMCPSVISVALSRRVVPVIALFMLSSVRRRRLIV